LMWSAAWALGGSIFWFVSPPEGAALLPRILLPAAIFWAPLGAFGGATFAALLFASRRRRIGQLSMSRIAAWGAMAGVLVPFGLTLGAAFRTANVVGPHLVAFFGECGAFGALCATTALMLARRAADNPSVSQVGPGGVAALSALDAGLRDLEARQEREVERQR
jgi:hypothetical protein